MKKYLVIERCGNETYVTSFESKEAALRDAEDTWNSMCEYDRIKNCDEFYVLESANPDPNSPDHYDGEILMRCK